MHNKLFLLYISCRADVTGDQPTPKMEGIHILPHRPPGEI